MSRFHRFLVLFPCWLLSFGCVPRPENEVVIYAAADREFATPILDGFERGKDKVSIARQFDVESSKTLGLVQRIEAESAKPSCDCFWNNEIMHTLRLQKKGLLQARRWPIPDTWPNSYRASDGSWVGFAARARVILVNKARLPQATEWPSSVLELANPKWKNRCGMAYPIYGTTATHLAVLSSHADKIPAGFNAESDSGKLNFKNWISTVATNAVVLSGNKQVALAVGRGDLDWCITDTDDAIIEKENGQPVEIVFPDQEVGQFGTLFIPKTRAVLKKYSLPLLNRMESVVTTCTIMCYALWSAGPKLNGASTPWMLLSLPFVIYGVFRYQLISEISNAPKSDNILSHAENSERPDEVLLKDFPIQVTIIGWVIVCFIVLFLKSKGMIE